MSNMTRSTTRILFDLFLAFFILEGWWFLAMPLALFGVWIFRYYYVEMILAGLIYDSLFGFLPNGDIYSYAGTILAIMLSIIAAYTKRVVRRSRI